MNKHFKALGYVGIIIIVSFIFMDFIFQYDNKYNGYQAPIKDGVLRLENIDIENDEIYSLVDNWDYYNHAYVTDANTRKPDQRIYLGQYPDFSMRTDNKSPFGIATYHLRIENDKEPMNLSLFIPEVDCAYELWINNVLVVQNGSLSKDQIKPLIKNQSVSFQITKTSDITIIAGNDSYYYSGVYFPLMLSSAKGIADMNSNRLIFYGLLCFSSLTMAIFSVNLWLRKRKSKLYIYFGITVLSFALQTALELLRYVGFSKVILVYTMSDFLYFLMLYAIVMMNLIITRQTGSLLDRFVVKPFTSFIFIIVMLHPFLFEEADASILNAYGYCIDAFKYMTALYIMYTSYIGLKENRPLHAYILSANCFYIIGVTYTLVYANQFEPVMFGWPNEYFSAMVVLLFMVYMNRRNSLILEQNEQLTLHLEEQVEERVLQVEELLKERKELLHEIAHDMKAPVSSIQTFIDQLHGVPCDEELASLLTIIEMKSDELSKRMTALQKFSNLESVEFKKHLFCIQDFIKKFHQNNRADSDAVGIHFDISLIDEPMYVYADELQLTRVFENLFFNALSYTPSEGYIILKQIENDTSFKLSFYNSGKEIPLKNQKDIFSRGFCARSEDNPLEHSGIGLYIARTILLQHGGNIQLESSPGKGVEFIVTLPKHNVREEL